MVSINAFNKYKRQFFGWKTYESSTPSIATFHGKMQEQWLNSS